MSSDYPTRARERKSNGWTGEKGTEEGEEEGEEGEEEEVVEE